MKTLTCREHGGTFQITPKRGRPPTRCGGDYGVCSRASGSPAQKAMGTIAALNPERIRQATGGPVMPAKLANRQPRETDDERMAQARRNSAAIRDTAPKAANPSVPMAMAAKERLEPLGWLCKASKDDAAGRVAFVAARDAEVITILWEGGKLVDQAYTLWDVDKPSANGKPKGSLSFDPDECTDRELVRALSGMKVTWWNVLGQKEESGIVTAARIKIEHAYNGTGDEMPGDRIVHFTDHAGTGFRAFRVGALLEVG